jgi:hypothetical protein
VFEIQNDIDFAGLMQADKSFTQFQISRSQRELAFQVKNYDAFTLPLLDVQIQAHPFLALRLGQSRFLPPHLPFEVRSELGCQVPGQVEPELGRNPRRIRGPPC